MLQAHSCYTLYSFVGNIFTNFASNSPYKTYGTANCVIRYEQVSLNFSLHVFSVAATIG